MSVQFAWNTQELLVDHSLGWRCTGFADTKCHFLACRLETDNGLPLSFEACVAKKIEIDGLFIDIEARSQVVLKLCEYLRELVHVLKTLNANVTGLAPGKDEQ
jgi:hypothetical protein